MIENLYAVTDENIFGFFKEHRFLSNFHECVVIFEGVHYPSTEAAYQAAKIEDPAQRLPFTIMTPAQAKKQGQSVKIRDDWDKIKIMVMWGLLFQKFSYPDLKEKLKQTGNRYLEETNYWGDRFWGADLKHVGENNLGKLLMKLREDLLKADTASTPSQVSNEERYREALEKNKELLKVNRELSLENRNLMDSIKESSTANVGANDLVKSFLQIALRKGDTTHWDGIIIQCKKILGVSENGSTDPNAVLTTKEALNTTKTWVVKFAYSGSKSREFFDIEFTTNDIDNVIQDYVKNQNRGEAKSDRIRYWSKSRKSNTQPNQLT